MSIFESPFVWVIGWSGDGWCRYFRMCEDAKDYRISSFVWRHATLQPGTERDDLGLGIVDDRDTRILLHPRIISNPYSVSAFVLGGPGV
jgi:hypothetical protein